MTRFFAPGPELASTAPTPGLVPDPGLTPGLVPCAGRVTIDADQAHHARRVLRMKIGDAVEVFDGRGHHGLGVLQEFTGRGAVVRLTEVGSTVRPRPTLTVATAIPKGPRADCLVEQLSQVGVDRLIPLRTQRSVVDPREGKLERFARAAMESARQCGRDYLMAVGRAMTLEAVLAEPGDLRLLAAPEEDGGWRMADGGCEKGTEKGAGGDPGVRASDWVVMLPTCASVLVLIGPEGGWTDEEMQQAQRAGCRCWSLGPHIMRIETAAVAAAAIVRYLARP
jgi:16S rRNA (uracil1498-N3)-methyltransferase